MAVLSQKLCTKGYQYHHEINAAQKLDVYYWCYDNFGAPEGKYKRWSASEVFNMNFHFNDSDDFTLFLLRWS